MSITPDELALIRAWTTDDLTLAVKTFQRAHPDPTGQAVADTSPASLVELRVLDILSQRLPAQLLATPLIPANQQDMADRLDALYENVNVAGWTTATPPAVLPANFYLGDIFETLDSAQPASVIVTATLPAGVDVQQGGLGPLSEESTTIHCLYVLPYDASRQRQIEALRGACAVANLLRTYRQDPVTLWVDGQVSAISRNVPRLASGVRFIVGVVTFSCKAFLPYTPTTGQSDI
ncbi:MAG: hypothetical protein ACRYFS_03655 [Janthinobacterium lividum]